VSDQSQSKVPIFVFVVGAILLGAAALLSVLVTVPNPGARTPPAVTADQGSPPKPASANHTVTEPVNTGALAGPGPGHRFEPLQDETSPEPAATATSEPAAAEPMSDADLAEIKAATRAAAEVAAAEAPGVQPDDQARKPSAEADTAEPVITAAAPHAANAGEPEASIAEPHAPASLSGAMAPPAKNEDAEKPSAPAPAAAAPPSEAPPVEANADSVKTPDQAPEPTAEAETEPSQPAPTPPPAKAADDSDIAAPAPTAGTTKTEPTANKPTPSDGTKPEHAPPAETETAGITPTPVPSAAPEPERATPMPVEAEPAPPMPSKKVVEAAPEVPKPEKVETPPPPAKTASEESSDDKRDAARSRQAAQPAETRQAEAKPGMRPMTLGFSGGLFKPKVAPAPRGRGKSSRAYGAAVRAAVGHHKPRGVGRGRVTVTFSIGPMGTLRGVSVARSSGNSQLDQAALAAVRSAAPFPAPPTGSGQTYSLPIYFH
jgi:periplasmic protein TonB